MIIPVRCFTCGAPVSAIYEEFKQRVGKGEAPEKIFNALGVKRYCCRRMLLSQVDMLEHISKFKKV